MAGSNILHFASVRTRAIGVGNLYITYLGLNDIQSKELVPIVLTPTDRKTKTRLGSFVNELAYIKFDMRSIDDQMIVNDITVFVKPLYSEYPG